MNVTNGSVDEDATDDSSSDFGMLNPDLLDLDLLVQGNAEYFIGPVSSTVGDLSLSWEEFCAFCSQLNEGQQLLFNFNNTQQLMVQKEIILKMWICSIFSLLVGQVLEKAFLSNVSLSIWSCSSHLVVRTFSVTVSIGKSATNVNGATLHYVF